MTKLPDHIISSTCICGGGHTSMWLEWNWYRCGGPASIVIKPFIGIVGSECIVDMVPVDITNVILMEICIANNIHEGIKAALGFGDSAIPKPIPKKEWASIWVGIVVERCLLGWFMQQSNAGKVFYCEVVIWFIHWWSGRLISTKQTKDALCRCKDPLYHWAWAWDRAGLWGGRRCYPRMLAM